MTKDDKQPPPLKVLLVGDKNVGKTKLVTRFTRDVYDSTCECSTHGAQVDTHHVQVNDTLVSLELWDIGGGEKSHALISSLCHEQTVVVLLVYDVSNHASFEHITNWYQTTQQTGAVKRFYLVGNKSDVSSNERAVTTEEANRFASDRGLFFIETSTKSGSNVTEAFQHIAEENIVTQEPPETPFKVVLIDIQRAAKQRELHCVETPLASSSQLTPFVALSYRWGELPEMLVDTSQDYMASVMSFHLTDLFDLCALMAQEPDLKTIPYLWLDAICVDQVNPVRRKATIYQMTAIYEQAAYIVAVPDLHREYLATSLVNSSRIISLIATYRHMIYCLIIQKEGMAATELDQQWMDSIGIPKGNLERRQWFMDTCFSKKIRCRPTATDMGDESVDAWWVRQVEEDDWKQQISQRGSDISQAMTFLTQLIVDWSSRVWVISEYQLAKKKPSGKMKYWFMLLGYSYFLGEPFFEFHFDATTRDANVGENKGTYAFQVDQSVRLFHNAMVRQLKEQSFLEMILGSKASKNEDRFYSILPLSEYRHQLISATDQKKKSIDQWHITTIVTVKVKLFEFMKALDQLTLLFLSFQQYTLILPSFATADVAWARLTEFQQYDHTNFDFSKPDQIVALSQRQLNNGSNGDKADVLSLQPKMYYRLHYNDESIQLITGVAPEDKQQQQLWHRLGLDTVHDRSWDMVCIPNDYGPAAINDPALEDMTKLLLLGNAEKNKWILYTTYSVNYWWQYNPSAWKTYDNQSTGTVFAIY